MQTEIKACSSFFVERSEASREKSVFGIFVCVLQSHHNISHIIKDSIIFKEEKWNSIVITIFGTAWKVFKWMNLGRFDSRTIWKLQYGHCCMQIGSQNSIKTTRKIWINRLLPIQRKNHPSIHRHEVEKKTNAIWL